MKDYDEKLFGENDDEILEGESVDPIDGLEDDIDFGEFDDLDVGGDFAMDDDRIDRLLDEIADLKRDMASGKNAGNQAYSSPYPSSGTNAPSEVALYNEISRLRDELSKTQHSQSMHMELNRMKEEMERDNKNNEERLLSEIKTLQKQIKSLKGEEDVAETEEARSSSDADIGALIRINESLVTYTKSFTTKLEAEIEELKKNMPDMPKLEELAAKLNAIKDMPVRVAQAASATSAPKPEKTAVSVTDVTEMMRRLVELRLQLGRLNKDEYEREIKTLALYDSLTVAKSAVYSTACGVAEKLDALGKLESELAVADDCYVYDIVVQYNALVDHLLSCQLTLDGVEVLSRLPVGSKITSTLSGETRAAATRFVGLVGEIGDRATGGAIDKLPEIVGLKNKLQGNRSVAENDALYDEVLTLNSDLVFITDAASAEKCASEIREKILRVCRLPYSEFVTYPHLEYDKRPVSAQTRTAAQEFVSELIGEDVKTSDEAMGALTSAVNLLRAEIADGALLSGGGDPSALRDLRSDVEHIKNAIDSLVGDDVDALVETENEDISKLLEEVKTLHSEVNTLSEGSPASPSSGGSTPDEVNLFLSEIVSLRDEVQSYKDEISGVIDRLGERADNGATFTAVSDASDNTAAMILDELTGMRSDLAGYAEELESVKSAVEELRTGEPLRAIITDDGTAVVAAPVSADPTLIAELDEIKKLITDSAACGDEEKLLALRDELLAAVGGITASPNGDDEKLNDIRSEIENVKQQLSDIQLYETVSTAPVADNAPVLEEIAALRDMIASDASVSPVAVDLSPLADRLNALEASVKNIAPSSDPELKSDIKKLSDALDGIDTYSQTEELKARLDELKSLVADLEREDDTAAIADIRETVHKLSDEPDYSVMKEILALREEFQLLKERMERSSILAADLSDSKLMAELNVLGDKLLEEQKRRNAETNAEIDSLRATVEQQKETQDALVGMIAKLLDKQDAMSEKLAAALSERDDASESGEAVLKEIDNIKYTLSVMQGADDKNADADLEASIGKLKAELSQMAGIVDEKPASKKKRATKKSDSSDGE